MFASFFYRWHRGQFLPSPNSLRCLYNQTMKILRAIALKYPCFSGIMMRLAFLFVAVVWQPTRLCVGFKENQNGC